MEKKYLIIAIASLLLVSSYLYLGNMTLRQEQRSSFAIPDIELTYQLGFSGQQIGYGFLTGFVWFASIDDQPQDARQYYTIEALPDFDASGQQLYTAKSYLKLPALSLKLFDEETLMAIENSPSSLTLAGESGNKFLIDKNTRKATLVDAQGDMTKLITSDSEFFDLMWGYWENI